MKLKILLIPILFKLRVLKFLNLVILINDIKIPFFGNAGYFHTLSNEKWLENLYQYLFIRIENLQSSTLIDVGVNLGQSILAAKKVNPDMEIIGFEPNPFCCFYTNYLININNLRKVDIVPSALANGAGLMNLYSKDFNQFDPSGSIIHNYRENQSYKTLINTVSEEILNSRQLNEVGVIKIDVEGAEVVVIDGLKKIISKYKPVIIMEVLPAYSNKNEMRVAGIENLNNFVRANDYKIFLIGPQNSFEELEYFEIHSNPNNINYLLLPKEKANIF